MPGHEPKRNVIQEPALFVLEGVEKVLEIGENVLKKIICHDLTLDNPGKSFEVVIVLTQRGQAVVSPIVSEMLLYVDNQALRQWFPVVEPDQEHKPFLKVL
jgi:hypothetical protein